MPPLVDPLEGATLVTTGAAILKVNDAAAVPVDVPPALTR